MSAHWLHSSVSKQYCGTGALKRSAGAGHFACSRSSN